MILTYKSKIAAIWQIEDVTYEPEHIEAWWRKIFGYVDHEDSDSDITFTLWHNLGP